MLTFMVGDVISIHHGDEIPLGVAAQGRLAKMGIVRDEIVGTDFSIGKVATPATRHEYLFAGPAGMVEHRDAAATLARFDGAHQS
jgi:hypothetical protein